MHRGSGQDDPPDAGDDADEKNTRFP